MMRSEQEKRAELLQVATQMAAALVPHMQTATRWELAEQALMVADALIEAVDERTK